MKKLCVICLLGTCLFAKEDEKLFITPNILSKNVHVVTGQNLCKKGVMDWIASINKDLEVGEMGEIVVETNFHLLFTSKNCGIADAKSKIQEVLVTLKECRDEQIKEALLQLTDVYRATFVKGEEGLKLVEDATILKTGDLIWRKLPESVEKSVYYSEKDLLVAMGIHGLKCTEIKRPCFYGNVKYKNYLQNENGNLGEAYIDANPFTIFSFVKTGEKSS